MVGCVPSSMFFILADPLSTGCNEAFFFTLSPSLVIDVLQVSTHTLALSVHNLNLAVVFDHLQPLGKSLETQNAG